MAQKCVFYLQEEFNVQKVLEFVKTTSLFSSDVYILIDDRSYNSKAVLGVVNLILTLNKGEEFTIMVEGEDAEYAIKKIKAFFLELTSASATNPI